MNHEDASSSDSDETIRPSYSQSRIRSPNTSWFSDSDDEEEDDPSDEQESDDSPDEGHNKEELEAQLEESSKIYKETKNLNEKQLGDYLEKNGNPLKNKYPDKYDDNKSISENAQNIKNSCEAQFNYPHNIDTKDAESDNKIKKEKKSSEDSGKDSDGGSIIGGEGGEGEETSSSSNPTSPSQRNSLNFKELFIFYSTYLATILGDTFDIILNNMYL